MATNILWDDDFSSYTPGPGHPTGWFDPGGDTAIVAFSTMTGSTPAPGFYEQTGQGFHLSGDQTYYIDPTSTNTSVQITWLSFNNVYGVNAYNVNLSTYTSTTSFPGQGQSIGGLILNPDFTVSLWARGTVGSIGVGQYPFATTEQQVFFQNTWQAWQMDIQVGEQVILGTGYVTFDAAVALEGVQIATCSVITNLTVASLYLGQVAINEYSFGGAGGANGYLGNFTGIVGTPLPPFGTWPHPGTPDAYYTQSVTEVIKAPGNSVRQVRWTQGVNEIIKLPSSSTRQARFTQGVVEIIRRVPPSLGYWFVYEA